MKYGQRSVKRWRFSLLALCFVPWLHAVPLLAASPASTEAHFRSFIDEFSPLFSDFDGDNRLDQAKLSSRGELKIIRVFFGETSSVVVDFKSNAADGGPLISGAIDNDGDIDLVWVSRRLGKTRAWLGDGRGNFSANADPVINFYRLLGSSESGSVKDSNEAGSGAISPGISLLVPPSLCHDACLPPQATALTTNAPSVSSSYSTGRNLRGP